jgi:Tol biopolymer transport system component
MKFIFRTLLVSAWVISATAGLQVEASRVLQPLCLGSVTTIAPNSHRATIQVTDGPDAIFGGGRSDSIYGGAGANRICTNTTGPAMAGAPTDNKSAATGSFPLLVDRVSVSSREHEARSLSEGALVSANGRYAVFASLAANLVGGDTNRRSDVFLRDRSAGTTTRVSVDRGSHQLATGGFSPRISSDARFIAFTSYASRERVKFYVYDRRSGHARKAFTDVGTVIDGIINYPELTGISDNGRFLLFDTHSRLLPRDHGLERSSVYLRDRRRHTFALLSLTRHERDIGAAYQGAASASGRLIAFATPRGVFLRDRVKHTTQHVSVSRHGHNQPSAYFETPSISAGGRYVTFTTDASNLVRHDTNHTSDVFIRDRHNRKTIRLSVSTTGQQANDYSGISAVSAHGRYVAFNSTASNLIGRPDHDDQDDIFLRDRRRHTTRCITIDRHGTVASGSMTASSLSPSGRWIGFMSESSHLVSGDTNRSGDAFVAKLR